MKLKELKTLLLENQCKERIVRASINKALKIPGSKLINLKPKEKKEDPTLRIIKQTLIPYNLQKLFNCKWLALT